MRLGIPLTADVFSDRWLSFALTAFIGSTPVALPAQTTPEAIRHPLTACVKQNHLDRLIGAEGSGSRRLLLLGDSHMDRSAAFRLAEAIQKTWRIDDWVARTTTYKQGASRNVQSGTYMLLGPAGVGLQTEHRPGDLMFAGTVENDIAILTSIGPMPGPTDEVVFTQFLVGAEDGGYASYSPSPGEPGNWYDGQNLMARPVLYSDGGTNTVSEFQIAAYRGESPLTWADFGTPPAQSRIYSTPLMSVEGIASGAAHVDIRGEPAYDETGKHYVTIGTQFALDDGAGGVPPGFALDTFAPFGWDTPDHARKQGPSRHYKDEHAAEYLRVTRLRPDERMTVMILLSHEQGVSGATLHEQRMESVLERWRELCRAADYDDPHFILIHPWAVPRISYEDHYDQARAYQRIADASPDISFISIAEATSYTIYDGVHGFPDYLDIFRLHWNNTEAVHFFGPLMWSLLTNNSRCRSCYADCDPSTGRAQLDIFDFICFQTAFAYGDPYACDCDTSTGPGVCDIFDFTCFSNAFVAGCR